MRGALLLGIALATTGCKQIFGLEPPTQTGDAEPSCAWRSIAAGYAHSCLVDPDGAVSCWGGNWLGQASPGGGDPLLEPTVVPLPRPALEVDAGRESTCARLDDESVWCWGGNTAGQLGIGSFNPTLQPTRAQLPPAAELDLGAYHACARRSEDGSIVCWGDNNFQQLGATSPDLSAVPVVVAGTAGSTALSVGHRFNCALIGGALACWGKNNRYQLGIDGPSRIAAPTSIAGIGVIADVAAAGSHTCAVVEATGEVRCWGSGYNGQLGNHLRETIDAADSPPAFTGAVDIAVTNFGTCARTAEGTLACWGDISYGDGTWSTQETAREVPLTGVTELAFGAFHQCAIANGQPVCWGANATAQLGRGMRSQFPTPVAVPVPAAADLLDVGQYYGCVRAVGKLYCWGQNNQGQLGDGTTKTGRTAVEISTGLASIAGFTTGNQHSCAWGNGSAACWGMDSNGQLARGTARGRELTPQVIAETGVTSMAVGAQHTCAALTTNAVKCWGANESGQLGNGTMTPSLQGTTIVFGGGMTVPIELASGWNHTCALTNGVVRCWGDNLYGQLGDGSTTDRTSPITVSGTGVSAIAAGRTHTCALSNTGAVYCWGDNRGGALGVGDTNMRTMPTQVALPAAATAISAGRAGTCARLMNGASYCWGVGWAGELGTGTLGEAHTPTEVTAVAGATHISRGDGGGCAIISGALSCWGDEKLIADGDISRDVPMPPNKLSCTR